MAFVEINPEYREALAGLGLASAGDFLACAGEPISVRPERRVERVVLGGQMIAYLKKETRILFRERLSSWSRGFGWTSKSVREGIVLGELARSDIGCPLVLALGEADGQAFVLLKDEPDLVPLNDFVHRRRQQTPRLARLLGRELARMHEAGFSHPDLFAKHILVGQTDGLDRICLIDWQRTRHTPNIPWSRRIVDLATLDASLASVGDRIRLRLLISYRRGTSGPRPSLRKLLAAIRSRTWLLLKQRRVRRQYESSLRTTPTPIRSHNWHGWHNLPVRLTDPSLTVLPLVNFLSCEADLNLRRRALRQTGDVLRRLHDAGYVPTNPGLSSWAVHAPAAGELEIVLTNVADLTPTSAPVVAGAADDFARLLGRLDSPLSRTDLLCVVHGYLGANDSRSQRRDLVRRILDARETAQ